MGDGKMGGQTFGLHCVESAAVKEEIRCAVGVVQYLRLGPDKAGKPGAQRLAQRFLGGPCTCGALCPAKGRKGVQCGPLLCAVHPGVKIIPGDAFFNALHRGGVHADACDHGAFSFDVKSRTS